MPALSAAFCKSVLWILLSLLLNGCKHIGLLFEPPSTLKAVVQGEVEGVAIHCEKTLNLGVAKWEVMCKVSDQIDIKYRTKTIDADQTKLEILIDKQNSDGQETIASPIVFVRRDEPAVLETSKNGDRIDIRAEQTR